MFKTAEVSGCACIQLSEFKGSCCGASPRLLQDSTTPAAVLTEFKAGENASARPETPSYKVEDVRARGEPCWEWIGARTVAD